MRSIRLRLLVPLSAGLALLLLLGGGVIYLAVSTTLRDGFDAALVAKARALASRLVLEIDPDVRPEAVRLGAAVLEALERGGAESAHLETRAELLRLAERGFSVRFTRDGRPVPEAPEAGRVDYFQIWLVTGEVLVRSPQLTDGDLPRPAEGFATPHLTSQMLPDGRPGRMAALRIDDVTFDDEAWQDVWSRIRGGEYAPVHQVVVVVAEGREAVDAALSRLGLALAVIGLVLVIGCAALVLFVLRRGLSPLAALERQIVALDAGSLDKRIRLARPASELTAVIDALNGALDELEGAFARERRTTAHIAHELRTPIAELRSLMEVADEFPDDEALRTQCLTQGREVAVQMSSMVSALLKVARLESGAQALHVEPLDVRPWVEGTWGLLRAAAGARRQTLDLEVEDAVVLHTDREAAGTILSNLLQNAIQHAPEGSTIRVRTRSEDGHVAVVIENPCPDLDPADLTHVSEPFWRRDAEGVVSGQGGLGLPLAAELARTAGLALELTLDDGWFRARLQSRRKVEDAV